MACTTKNTMVVVYGLLLQAKGDVRRIKLKDSTEAAPLNTESLQTILKKKTPVQELGKYTSSEYTLTLFGYKSGKAGTENKHILLPPMDSAPTGVVEDGKEEVQEEQECKEKTEEQFYLDIFNF